MRRLLSFLSMRLFCSSHSLATVSGKQLQHSHRLISSTAFAFNNRHHSVLNGSGVTTTTRITKQQSAYTFGNTRGVKSSTSLQSSTLSNPSSITSSQEVPSQPPLKVNLLTIHQPELESLLQSWSFPKYRAKQILDCVQRGVTNFDEMNNIPKKLRTVLEERTTIGTLQLEVELNSKDGTKKRAYRLWDGQLIESVLMPYDDGRATACISSQAGCAMGCVFCATGQMGFARQLTPDEIYEQVARFASELQGQGGRLSNVVLMGMGEPLANYRNVMTAVKRMNDDLGIGARKITISTVGIVPNIKKLMHEELQVRLAVSLHCSNEEERSALLPANKRYGGLDELMMTIKEYINVTNRRITLEWALIEGQNDKVEVAKELGNLIKRFGIRRDMIHVNVIPLNPTGGFAGSPSGRMRVNAFLKILEDEFGIKATPRVRRGIDIEAGCGQLKASVKKKEDQVATNLVEELKTFANDSITSKDQHKDLMKSPTIGVYEDEDEAEEDDELAERNKDAFLENIRMSNKLQQGDIVDFAFHGAVNLDEESDFDDETFDDDLDKQEADRLINLVQQSFKKSTLRKNSDAIDVDQSQPILVGPTTSIVDENSVRNAKRKRKKLLKNIKAIDKLRNMELNGKVLNQEQREKIAKEAQWQLEIESIEHNLQ